VGSFQRHQDGRLPVLEAGDQVEFGYEAAQQDSFRFVATWVRKL
jgi:hypothetical protein